MHAAENGLGRPSSCSQCVMAKLSACTLHRFASREPGSAVDERQSMLHVPRRRLVCRAQDSVESVLFLCDGWAASLRALANGDRQILSFLLPGDIVSSALLFQSKPNILVESISDVSCRVFARQDVLGLLTGSDEAISQLSRIWMDEREQAARLAVDLGRRTAEERIANLLLGLMDRLALRGLVREGVIDFPLRQHHVADATGLTPVHVSKVLTDFKRRGLLQINDRFLQVLDETALRRIAQAQPPVPAG